MDGILGEPTTSIMSALTSGSVFGNKAGGIVNVWKFDYLCYFSEKLKFYHFIFK